MQPVDTTAVEAALWSDFVQGLARHLAAQWPAMPERLGERYTAFVERSVQQAQQRGLTRAAAVARYVNLCFVWGPAFHDKPGFEWAAGLLAAPPGREWATVHRLVQRSLAELHGLADARIAPAALAAADERLIDVYGTLGVQGALLPAEPPAAPRRACDLEAAELRLLQAAQTQRYVLEAGHWQRAALAVPPPLRIGAADPAPPLVAVLSHAPGCATPARLQLRARSQATCDGDVHPALQFSGSHGLWRWAGHETRALSWPLHTLAASLPRAGAGTALGEETSPDVFKLTLDVCGLRDDGDALGGLDLQVWVWPADQWWLELQRTAAPSQAVSAAVLPTARASTQCRLERDGQPHDATALRRGFEAGVDVAGATALQTLAAAWAGVEGLGSPALEGTLAALIGRAAFTWGWQLSAQGLGGRALLRLVGEMDLQAAQADLQLGGELQQGGARSRVQLRCKGDAPLRLRLAREAAEPPLLPLMAAAVARFRWPFEAELVPLASDSAAILQAAGPCAGALVGEAGLRPRTSGGSGFEWFAALRLEPVALPVTLIDPLLGRVSQVLPLLAAQTLLDWSLG